MKTPTVSQWKVINYPYIPRSTLKVIAGPGSGKTFTLLYKVYELINKRIVTPDEILILSLTNKAVDNIASKLLDTLESLNQGCYSSEELSEIIQQIGIYTIHGLANKIVTENVGLINVIEENGWKSLMKLVPKDFWKKQGKTQYKAELNSRNFEKVLREYQSRNKKEQDDTLEKLLKIMKSSNVVTNDDLILFASQCLRQKDDIGVDKYINQQINKYKIIIIDEFQDLYPSITPLLQDISLDKQLIMFGDPNQSIYGFLGSNTETIAKLESLRPTDKIATLKLYDNFRCTPEIIHASNTIMGVKRHEIEDASNLELKDPSNVVPQIINDLDSTEELEFIIDQICQLVCSSAKLDDIAILTRTNNHMKCIGNYLKLYGIPIERLSAQPDWLNDPRIKYLIDLMRIATSIYKNDHLPDDIALTCMKRSDFCIIVTLSMVKGIANKTVRNLFEVSNTRSISIWHFISRIPSSEWPYSINNKKKIMLYVDLIKKMVYDNEIHKIDSPFSLLKVVTTLATQLNVPLMDIHSQNEMDELKMNLTDFLKILKLCSLNRPSDKSLIDWFLESYVEQSLVLYQYKSKENQANSNLGSVKLSTIHSSKGLEFPIVFLMGTGNHSSKMEDKVQYVGMTRARNLLYITNVKHNRMKALNKEVALPLLGKTSFWEYYNKDVQRSYSHLDSRSSWKNYNRLKDKYMINISKCVSCISVIKCAVRGCKILVK